MFQIQSNDQNLKIVKCLTLVKEMQKNCEELNKQTIKAQKWKLKRVEVEIYHSFVILKADEYYAKNFNSLFQLEVE